MGTRWEGLTGVFLMFCVLLQASCKLLQHVGRVSWPGGSVASERGRIKQQLWPRRWSVTPFPAGADNKDSLGRPGQTRPDKHDKTGRGCKLLGVAIGASPLALPARDPLAEARNRGHGSALQRRLRPFFSCSLSLLLCHALPICPPIYPIRPHGHPRLCRTIKVLSVAPVTTRTPGQPV